MTLRARLSRTVGFSAAHRYHRPEWSEDRNREVFGDCATEHGHGHNYRCTVTVEGPLDRETSMVMDLRLLDRILSEEVLAPFDHRHLNHAVPEFEYGRTVPTAEALSVYVWGRVEARLPSGVSLTRVRVREDDHLFAEYEGEGDRRRSGGEV